MRTMFSHGAPLAASFSVVAGLGRRIARNHGLDRDCFDHQPLALHQESKALPVGGLKAALMPGKVAKGHHQRRIAACVAHMHAAVHTTVALADLLPFQFGLGGGGQRIQPSAQRQRGSRIQRHFDRLLRITVWSARPMP
jgi:hypothetical protein